MALVEAAASAEREAASENARTSVTPVSSALAGKSVCFTGVPCYQHIVALIDFIQYSYSRLIVPMATDGRAVDGLIICINARKFPDFTI